MPGISVGISGRLHSEFAVPDNDYILGTICIFIEGEGYMAEFHESKDNPLHKDFGVLSNTIYILKKEKQYRPSAIWYKLLGIVCGSILSYFWGVFGKYVIDIVEAGGTTEESLSALLKLLLIAGCVFAVLTFGDVTSNNKVWFKFIEIRMKMILERIDKALRMNYQLLEKPEVLDLLIIMLEGWQFSRCSLSAFSHR